MLGFTRPYFSGNYCVAIPKYDVLLLRYTIIPCGLVARIRRSHRRGRGSIPRKGETNFHVIFDFMKI